MAANRMSVLNELYDSVFNYSVREEFTENIWSLNASDGMTVREFNEHELSNDFNLDRSHMLDDKKFYDGNHVFTLFSKFSDMSANEVRELMISDIRSSKDYYNDVCKVPLFMRGDDIDTWLEHMEHPGVRADEIAIFALAVCSQRHVVIYTHSKPWSTINFANCRPNVSLYSHCSVHLLYMGNNLYGRLVRKPSVQFTEDLLSFPLSKTTNAPSAPPHQMPTPVDLTNLSLLSNLADSMIKLPEQQGIHGSSSGNDNSDTNQTQGNITVIQDNTSTNTPSVEAAVEGTISSTNTPSVEAAVEGTISGCNEIQTDMLRQEQHTPTGNVLHQERTKTPQIPLSSSESTEGPTQTVNKENNNSDDSTESRSMNTAHTIIPDVINRDCTVKLRRLTQEDIDLHTMQLPAVITDAELLPGYFMRSRPEKKRHNVKPARNIASVTYFESSSESSAEYVSPVPKSKPSCRPGRGPSSSRIAAQRKKSEEPKVKPRSVTSTSSRADVIDNEDEAESNRSVTDSNASDTHPQDSYVRKSGRAVFETKTHGIRKVKKHRWFKCKFCDIRTPSTKELNRHYRDNHSKQDCPKCGKSFSSPETLTRHAVMHKVNKYPCRTCGKTFAFESKLDEHRITHRRHGNKRCNHGTCGKIFKRDSDLDRHILTHNVKPIKCEHCSYTNTDIRNVRQHMRKHDKIGRYACPHCGKRFKYHVQKTRHLKSCNNNKSA